MAERFEGSRLLICRGEIPIVGSNPTGHANKANSISVKTSTANK